MPSANPRNSVMPKGVEHMYDSRASTAQCNPRNSVMPKGVEHTTFVALLALHAVRETP